MNPTPRTAPEIMADDWVNTDQDLALADFRGRVVILEAFQMLCPGCVSHGLPQAKRIQENFDPRAVAVIGLHSVFEHHDAMQPPALKAFLREYRITFPVAVDATRGTRNLPKTMDAYGMQGTPTLVIIDQVGRRRAQHFGHVHDLVLGAQIGALLGAPSSHSMTPSSSPDTSCDDTGCQHPLTS